MICRNCKFENISLGSHCTNCGVELKSDIWSFKEVRLETGLLRDQWNNISFILPTFGHGKVIKGEGYSLQRRRSMISIVTLLLILWFTFGRPLDPSDISIKLSSLTISIILLLVYLVILRGLRSYLCICESTIKFRNIFRMVDLPVYEIASIETAIYTHDKQSGPIRQFS